MRSYLYVLIFIAIGCDGVFGQKMTKKFHIITNMTETWHKALHYCMARGWRLASITSKTENDQIIKQIRESGFPNHYWTSGTVIGNEPYFYWMGHDQPFTFNDWGEGEPNNLHFFEDCLELKYWDDIFKWNDTKCDTKLLFVCEEALS